MRRFHIGSPEWSPPRVPVQLPLGYGSLGWLVHLLNRQKVNLLEIDLAPIAQACYDYWCSVGDLDDASDSLAILAHLTERKAERLLMPAPEPEPPEPEWLEPTRLSDAYLPVIDFLRERETARLQIFFRNHRIDIEPIEALLPKDPALPDLLWHALQRVLTRATPPQTTIPERRFFSIHARIIDLHEQLYHTKKPIRFESLLEPYRYDIYEVLLSFLAILEMWRLGQIDLIVDEAHEIWLENRDDADRASPSLHPAVASETQ